MTQPPSQPPPPRPTARPLATGAVDLTVQTFPMTVNLVTPDAWINGQPVQVGPGTTSVPVPAGPVRVDVSMRWMQRCGEASVWFDLAPGQRVPVFYAAPAHQFAKGAIGHQPMGRPGRLAVNLTMTVVVAMVTTFAILLPILR